MESPQPPPFTNKSHGIPSIHALYKQIPWNPLNSRLLQTNPMESTQFTPFTNKSHGIHSIHALYKQIPWNPLNSRLSQTNPMESPQPTPFPISDDSTFYKNHYETCFVFPLDCLNLICWNAFQTDGKYSVTFQLSINSCASLIYFNSDDHGFSEEHKTVSPFSHGESQ